MDEVHIRVKDWYSPDHFLFEDFLLFVVDLFAFSGAFFFTVLVVFVEADLLVFESPFLVTIPWLKDINYLRSTSKYKRKIVSKIYIFNFI